MRNIKADIKERMAILQKVIDDLNRKRTTLDEQLRIADERGKALRLLLDWEPPANGSPGAGKPSANETNLWLGVGLRDAVRRLMENNPGWDFERIRDRLVDDGFDFKGKKPGSAVNMAIISLRRTQKSGDEAKG